MARKIGELVQDRITVIRKEPRKAPEIIRIKKTAAGFSEIGGYLKSAKIASDLAVVYDVMGKKHGKEFCFSFAGKSFYGTAFLVGVKADGFSFDSVRGAAQVARFIFGEEPIRGGEYERGEKIC